MGKKKFESPTVEIIVVEDAIITSPVDSGGGFFTPLHPFSSVDVPAVDL